jgi:hypothetical protein
MFGSMPNTIPQTEFQFISNNSATFATSRGLLLLKGVPMKLLGVMLLALGLSLCGCGGGNPHSGNINGNWTAILNDSGTEPVFVFSTTFTQTNGMGITVSHFTFTTSSPCFVSGGTETGSFALGGDFNGNVTGMFGLTIQSGTPDGNTLILQGTVKDNRITGTWTLSGVTSGCTGNGIFTINKS